MSMRAMVFSVNPSQLLREVSRVLKGNLWVSGLAMAIKNNNPCFRSPVDTVIELFSLGHYFICGRRDCQ